MKQNTTTEKARLYDAVAPVFRSLYSEFQELSKKKPESTLSKSKVAIANRVLADIKNLVEGYPTAKYLDLLKDDDLPQNSDVVLIMSQYVGALDNFHGLHHGYQTGLGNAWFIDDTNPGAEALEEL